MKLVRQNASEFKGSLDSNGADDSQSTHSGDFVQRLGNTRYFRGITHAAARAGSRSVIAAVISDATHPTELWLVRGNGMARVTSHNDNFRRGASLD